MHIFNWNEKNRWLTEINQYAAPLLNKQVKQQLKQIKPECDSDNFDWLPMEYGAENFAELFSGYYTHIRLFHACRPEKIESYFLYGLRGQSATLIEESFCRIFSDVPHAAKQEAIDSFQKRKESEKGAIYLILEKDELIETSGHYLIQGSEYLLALAATLSKIHPGEDYRLRLREIGIPTIFEIHTPITYFDKDEINALSNLVLSEWGQKVTKKQLDGMGVLSLLTYHDIEPEYIIGHSHPARIRDSHSNNPYYHNTITTCEYCTN